MASENVDKWRRAHHSALALIFGVTDGLTLWRKLVRLEITAHRAAEDYCNGTIGEKRFDGIKVTIAAKVAALSHNGKLPAGFFINGDPRGYALKIESEQAKQFDGLHRDWGGYGCLAAQID